MPRIYTRRFRVRATDCDAVGYVNHAVYLRYMQEMAMEASADAGYSSARYTAMGVGWVIRRSRIDYLQPARYGDDLDATTYVVNFRRARSQRNYEIARASDGAMLAQAATDWVFIDMRTGLPSRLPADMPSIFLPDGPLNGVEQLFHAPNLPDRPPESAFRTTRRIYFYEMDQYRHVNNAVYLNYLEQAAIDACADAGFDLSRLDEMGGLFIIRQHDIEYLRPARYGDSLDIATWISQLTTSSLLRHTTMHIHGGDLAIRAQTRWVWIDLARRASAPIPDALLATLKVGA